MRHDGQPTQIDADAILVGWADRIAGSVEWHARLDLHVHSLVTIVRQIRHLEGSARPSFLTSPLGSASSSRWLSDSTMLELDLRGHLGHHHLRLIFTQAELMVQLVMERRFADKRSARTQRALAGSLDRRKM